MLCEWHVKSQPPTHTKHTAKQITTQQQHCTTSQAIEASYVFKK